MKKQRVYLDKVAGVIFGQAIGDAIGAPYEFRTANEIWETKKLRRVKYRPVGTTWGPGEYTDDTAQALCILDTFLALPKKKFSAVPYAKAFQDWLKNDGRGCGRLTYQTLSDPTFAIVPYIVAKRLWEDSDRKSAPNGAVMRTSVVGLLDPTSVKATDILAKQIARITHFDPRCVASATAVSVVINRMIRGDDNVDSLIKTANNYAADTAIPNNTEKFGKTDLYKEAFPLDCNIPIEVKDLLLDEGLEEAKKAKSMKSTIGYTYKTLLAGFWALRSAEDELKCRSRYEAFQDILEDILFAGGDVDTNAAVACSLLGGYFGLSGIPPHLVAGLKEKTQLMLRVDKLKDYYRSINKVIVVE